MAKRFRIQAWIVLFFCYWVGSAAGASLVRTPDFPTPSVFRLSGTAVAAFATARIPKAMREEKIPGAVFVVVRGDQVVFQKGYGLANVESRKPVSVRHTLFRVASISKILTAASVLQLVHARRLSLHRNVNRYLASFHIAPAFGAPITLADLLTHSSGFDVCPLDYAARTKAQKLSLRRYLIAFQPIRIRPPGVFSGYDNYGYTLAGYLVQKVSGIPFPQYVEERLLQPLDMDHSSFTPSAALRRRLATGYWLDDGSLRPCRPDHVNITPAAGLCSTASDMSQFLVALLADQRPNGTRAFSSSVMNGLESQQFTFNRAVPGRCYGFDEVNLDGRTVLRQTGQWPGFNSLLLLIPRQHCGVFIAYNLCDQLRMARQISRRFAEQFIPPPKAIIGTEFLPDPPPGTLRPLCGSYLSVRFPKDLPALGVPPGLEVTHGLARQLEIGGRPYREIKPLVFEQIIPGGIPGRRATFRLRRDGQVADLIMEGGAFRRVPWSQTKQGYLWLLRAASLVFISVVVLWPIMFVVRSTGVSTVSKSSIAAAKQKLVWLSWSTRGMAFAACVLALWFEASWTLTELRLHPFADFYGLPGSIESLMGFMPVLMIFTVGLVVFSAIAWCNRLWTFVHRLHYTLIPVAFVLFLYIFYSEHFLFVAYVNGRLM